MPKESGKNFRLVFLVALIMSVVMMSSPLRALMTLLFEATPSPCADIAMFVEPQAVESSAGLVPQSSRHQVFSHFNRTLDSPLIFVDCTVVVDNAQACHERYFYLRDNDLDFNIPTITYRQPSSQHASEG